MFIWDKRDFDLMIIPTSSVRSITFFFFISFLLFIILQLVMWLGLSADLSFELISCPFLSQLEYFV